MMEMAKAIELISGLCLLLNLWVPLALILLLPVLINITGTGFHVLPGAWKRNVPMLLSAMFLMATQFRAYLPLLKMTQNSAKNR